MVISNPCTIFANEEARSNAKISEFKRETHCYKTLRRSTEDKQTDNSQLGDACNGWYFGFSISEETKIKTNTYTFSSSKQIFIHI